MKELSEIEVNIRIEESIFELIDLLKTSYIANHSNLGAYAHLSNGQPYATIWCLIDKYINRDIKIILEFYLKDRLWEKRKIMPYFTPPSKNNNIFIEEMISFLEHELLDVNWKL